VWEIFDVIVDAVTSSAMGFVLCHKCETLLKYNISSGISSLKRHADSGCQKKENSERHVADRDLKKRVTKLCVEMCAKDCRPFSTVAGEGFKNLAQELLDIGATKGKINANDLLPHPTTISRNVRAVTEGLREKVIPEVDAKMSKGQCHCTSDMWCDKHTHLSYIAVTAHYIDNEWAMKNTLLLLNDYPVEEDHSGLKIIDEVCTGRAELIKPISGSVRA